MNCRWVISQIKNGGIKGEALFCFRSYKDYPELPIINTEEEGNSGNLTIQFHLNSGKASLNSGTTVVEHNRKESVTCLNSAVVKVNLFKDFANQLII